MSDEEAEMLKMGNRTYSEYSRCVKIEDGQKTEQTSLVSLPSANQRAYV